MLIHTNKSCLVASVLVLLSTATLRAQRFQPFTEIEQTYDLQLFAPTMIPELDGSVPPNDGVYFTYDRVYSSMSQPNLEEWGPGSDFAWGHRYEFGYMTEDQHGWIMTIWNMGSPSQFFVEPSVDRNGAVRNDLLGNAVGTLVNSINDGRLWGIELNKIFRLEPTARGTTFEPFLGIRYAKFDDFTTLQTFTVTNVGTLAETNSFSSTNAVRSNEMIGGQIGLRSQSRRGRLVLSAEVRAFALQNFQDQNQRNTQENIFQVLTPPLFRQEFFRTDSGYQDQKLVIGGELRVEAAVEISREVAARVGLDVTEFARGIGRGFDQANSEDLTLAGVTFGITVNR